MKIKVLLVLILLVLVFQTAMAADSSATSLFRPIYQDIYKNRQLNRWRVNNCILPVKDPLISEDLPAIQIIDNWDGDKYIALDRFTSLDGQSGVVWKACNPDCPGGAFNGNICDVIEYYK